MLIFLLEATRNVILGHSLKGMDAYYLNPTDQDLAEAMDQYPAWLDEKASKSFAKSVANE